jgi:monofunctional glycosyltransferase
MLRKSIKFIIYLILFFFVSTVGYVCLLKFIPPSFTPPMIIRIFEGAYDGKFVGINKDWESFSEISPNFFRAVIAAEDGRFLEHNGIDWKAVEDSKKYNLRHKGKKKRGASTITMQTAKNTFLCHSRNYVRKALEVYFTVLIEAIWGKKRILEMYANVIEFGSGIYGVEEASQTFFNKSAIDLTKREAALLAAVLPNPHRWSPAKPTKYINRRVRTIMARMQGVALPE